ncbi:GTP--adenosylcobinamide-phosphateguanylyl transferase [Halopiger xanaduensis]|uniref:GTP:adenosylcobinamide-phosphateguanylyl transferase-like protein n=1 Tax=Halopiger xanaduensis (strain DSM 18323 / JCM 14033 / SH-6) TaxID=797210 RepID=F8D9C3_HALXS|nr:GTP--adenosylcobinamide-phosphateguanylyl transferase [Halopiger xanaduensis]AEH36859.1 GTP:adenosylcobinamide-phosphateguanylyl transferase-like protein [Halopiger xanaduensis SH-6]
MCGGKGTRLESPREKPLHPIGGTPMVDRVVAALADSRVETIYAAVSPNAPETRARLERAAGDREDLTAVETPGEGYVADLMAILERDDISTPVLTVAADLPLLEAPVVDRVLERHVQGERGRSRTVCVPVALKRRLGVSVDSQLESRPHLAPTGVNVVGDADAADSIDVHYDARLAVNVNRLQDARIADEWTIDLS